MAITEERRKRISENSKQYWREVHSGLRPSPRRPGPRFTKKLLKKWSEKAKKQWEALSPEAKEAEKARLNSINACSWDEKKKKEVHAKIAATNRKPENRLKMSKALKKACARPETKKNKSEARIKWAQSPAGKAWAAELSRRFKGIRKSDTLRRESELRWAKENGIVEEAELRYKQEQERYYNMAVNALKGTGIVPDKGQIIDYYKEIINYFEPDWLG